MTRPQNLNDVFPFLRTVSGSGSGNGFFTEIEREYQAVDENSDFHDNFRPLWGNLPSDNQDLDQDGPGEDLII